MAQVTTKWIADNAVNDLKIDWGTSTNQVYAASVPLLDDGGYFGTDTVESAIAALAGKKIANWDQVNGKMSGTANNVDVDTQIKAAATTDTHTTNFTTLGVFVDAADDYSGGLPASGTQVTEYGRSGYVQIRNSTSKDPIDDGSGNEVYGVLFQNTNDSKYYLKFFSDVSDVQTAYTFGTTTSLDFIFVEIFDFIGMPNEAFTRNGFGGFVDLVAGDITAVTAGAGLTGGGSSGSVTLDVGAGDGIDVSTNDVAVDVTDLVDANYGTQEVGTNNIGVLLQANGGLDQSGTGIVIDVTDFIDTGYGLTESSNTIRLNVDTGVFQFNTGVLDLKADGVDDTHINWGTGAGQVGAADVPILDAGGYTTQTEVEGALAEIYAKTLTGGNGIATSGVFWSGITINADADEATITATGGTGSVQLAVKADGINDTHIDWGTGTNQVSGVDVPILDSSNYYTTNNVEAALAQLGAFALTAGDGIDISGSIGTGMTVAVDVTDFIDTTAGLKEDLTNNIQVNLAAAGGLDFATGAIQIKADGVKDTMIDWGTGAGQVAAGDVPLADASNYWTTDTVEGALDEIGPVAISAGNGITSSGTIGAANLTVAIDIAAASPLTGTGGTGDQLDISADGIKDTHIDWGTGAGQVSAGDIPLLDAGNYYTVDTVEAALQEIAGSEAPTTVYHTVSGGEATAGYFAVGTKAKGAAGTKTYIQVCPIGGCPQQYLVDFTSMNNDANGDLVIIWKTSGAVTGIASPTYPSTGLVGIVSAGDIFQVVFES